MFFPLLEALLQKNPELCKMRLNDFIRSGEDPSSLYKSLLAFAAQHAISDNSKTDAVVMTDGLVHVIQHNLQTNSLIELNSLIEQGIDYLCAIPIETIDSTVLKPDREHAKVVSVSDLEESFEQTDADHTINTVRDLLGLMDNKRYFMEIIYQTALLRSPQSVLIASSTSRAIEVMGWKNNFTPFLIYHMIMKLFDDRYRFVNTGESMERSNLFEWCIPKINKVLDLNFLDALYRIYHDSKILTQKIRLKIVMRLSEYFNSKDDANSFIADKIPMMDTIICRSSIYDLASLDKMNVLRSKFPFAV